MPAGELTHHVCCAVTAVPYFVLLSVEFLLAPPFPEPLFPELLFFEPPELPPDDFSPPESPPLDLPDDEASSGDTLTCMDAYVMPGSAFCARTWSG